jgi:hypothetical protein
LAKELLEVLLVVVAGLALGVAMVVFQLVGHTVAVGVLEVIA